MLKTLQRRRSHHHHPSNACSVPSEFQLTTLVCAPSPQNSAENTLVDQHATLWDLVVPADHAHLVPEFKIQHQMLTALAPQHRLRSSENTLAVPLALLLDTVAILRKFQ
jgi:hypothetical protein